MKLLNTFLFVLFASSATTVTNGRLLHSDDGDDLESVQPLPDEEKFEYEPVQLITDNPSNVYGDNDEKANRDLKHATVSDGEEEEEEGVERIRELASDCKTTSCKACETTCDVKFLSTENKCLAACKASVCLIGNSSACKRCKSECRSAREQCYKACQNL